MKKKRRIFYSEEDYIYSDIDIILCNDVRLRIYIHNKSKDF